MYVGPRPGTTGTSSVGDSHFPGSGYSNGSQIHISRFGFAGEILTPYEKAHKTFRHELKHMAPNWPDPDYSAAVPAAYKCDQGRQHELCWSVSHRIAQFDLRESGEQAFQ